MFEKCLIVLKRGAFARMRRHYNVAEKNRNWSECYGNFIYWLEFLQSYKSSSEISGNSTMSFLANLTHYVPTISTLIPNHSAELISLIN